MTKIDYHVASHYHSDHIGCTGRVRSTFPLQQFADDRAAAIDYDLHDLRQRGRHEASDGDTGDDDHARSGFATPSADFVRGVQCQWHPDDRENDLSLVALVRFGHFEAVFGGDLSGASTGTVDPDPARPHRPHRRHRLHRLHRRLLTVHARGPSVHLRQPPPSATTGLTRRHRIDWYVFLTQRCTMLDLPRRLCSASITASVEVKSLERAGDMDRTVHARCIDAIVCRHREFGRGGGWTGRGL